MSTTVCKYFPRGTCNYGSNCKFLHLGQPTMGNKAGGNTLYASGPPSPKESFALPSLESIRADLTERPTWILSSYGPGKDPPAQLIDSKDLSPEEARLIAYKLRDAGNLPALEQKWQQLQGEADTQIKNILKDIPGALNYIKQAQENKGILFRYYTPGEKANQAASVSVFGQSNKPAPFGVPTLPSTFGAPTSMVSAFTTPSKLTSTFGQPLQSTPAFGQSAPAPSPFGMTAQPTPGFSQSSFGQAAKPSLGQPTFGKPTGPAASPFATSSAIGSATPAFGRPSFGQTNNLVALPFASAGTNAIISTFSKPAFGQISGPAASPFASAASTVPAFAQPAFGQTSGPAASPFATTIHNIPTPAFSKSAFGQSSLGQSLFTPTAPPGGNASPFAAPATNAPSPGSNPFGHTNAGASTSSPFTQAKQHQQPSPFSQSQKNENPFGRTQASTVAQTTRNPFSQSVQLQPQSSLSNINPFQSSSQPQQAQAPFDQAPTQHAQQPNPFSQQTTLQKQPSIHSQHAEQKVPESLQASGYTINLELAAAQHGVPWADPDIQYAPEEIEWFAAPMFESGRVPLVAPSRSMCWG